ncbi:MAG: DUF1211 domain-containing protein [Fimbriimonadaceae bacterium]|nr:DUF1211 domain-containing protein [Fimbriimonadaceae bacterium]
MTKGRLEAFTDGVVAILITIMVLELKVPHGSDLSALREIYPTLLAYLMSFVLVGIYWNNHHHMMHAAKHVDGGVMWSNLNLLFWLSLVPFTTNWMDETMFAPTTVGVYGVNLLLCAIAYAILVRALVRLHGRQSDLAQRIGRDYKGNLSVVFYVVGVAVSYWLPAVALACYVAVTLTWLVPDRRFAHHGSGGNESG